MTTDTNTSDVAHPDAVVRVAAFSVYQKFVVGLLAFLQFSIVLDLASRFQAI